MTFKSDNQIVSRVLAFIFNIDEFRAKFPFEICRYNNELTELEFLTEVKGRFEEHSDAVIRQLEEDIVRCQENENQQMDK